MHLAAIRSPKVMLLRTPIHATPRSLSIVYNDRLPKSVSRFVQSLECQLGHGYPRLLSPLLNFVNHPAGLPPHWTPRSRPRLSLLLLATHQLPPNPRLASRHL